MAVLRTSRLSQSTMAENSDGPPNLVELQKIWDDFIEQNYNWLVMSVVFSTITILASKALGLNRPRNTHSNNPSLKKDKQVKALKSAKGVKGAKVPAEQEAAAGAAAREGDEKDKGAAPMGITPYIIIGFSILRIFMVFFNRDQVQWSIPTSDLQPLVKTSEFYLPQKALASLREGLVAHPLSGNTRGDFNPTVVRGFTVAFDHRGVDAFEESEALEPLHAFFGRTRVSDCNAWELSVLVRAPPCLLPPNSSTHPFPLRPSSLPPRTKWTRRVPHPVLIGHARRAKLSPLSPTAPRLLDRSSTPALTRGSARSGRADHPRRRTGLTCRHAPRASTRPPHPPTPPTPPY